MQEKDRIARKGAMLPDGYIKSKRHKCEINVKVSAKNLGICGKVNLKVTVKRIVKINSKVY